MFNKSLFFIPPIMFSYNYIFFFLKKRIELSCKKILGKKSVLKPTGFVGTRDFLFKIKFRRCTSSIITQEYGEQLN